MKVMLLAITLIVLMLPIQAAANANTYCLNDSWSRTSIAIDDETKTIDDYCPYGCDSGRGICTDYSGSPGTAIPFWLFVVFELISLSLLAFSFLTQEPIYKMLSSLMSLILLFSLGFLAVNIMTDQGAVSIIWLSWLNIFLAWVGVIMFIASMFYVVKDGVKR